jgi:hypothetical protein
MGTAARLVGFLCMEVTNQQLSDNNSPSFDFED